MGANGTGVIGVGVSGVTDVIGVSGVAAFAASGIVDFIGVIGVIGVIHAHGCTTGGVVGVHGVWGARDSLGHCIECRGSRSAQVVRCPGGSGLVTGPTWASMPTLDMAKSFASAAFGIDAIGFREASGVVGAEGPRSTASGVVGACTPGLCCPVAFVAGMLRSKLSGVVGAFGPGTSGLRAPARQRRRALARCTDGGWDSGQSLSAMSDEFWQKQEAWSLKPGQREPRMN